MASQSKLLFVAILLVSENVLFQENLIDACFMIYLKFGNL